MSVKNILQYRWLTLTLRLLLGFIFIYSGFSKLGDLAGFAEAIDNYRILPRPAINVLAIILPWIELLSGASLLSGILLRGGAILIASAMAIFTAAVATSMARGIDITCGCSTPFKIASRVGFGKLLEDVILLAAALLIFFFDKPIFSFALDLDKNPAPIENPHDAQPE
ncbi:MAG: DoxX family membrane protein [candidate division KSB1 bacterium]|nr:DoxX family membrane protein [candidate division KSB1 bacterium]MDZ7302937.1 DoxX family membrane protein [candidate division KSB1 bacterium]MDZ7312213.1 DoxX family membrane protein [candidate division KSB1 bacterium]